MIFVKTNFGLYTICMLLMLLMPLALIAQSAHHSLRQGDERYDKAKYAESEKYYAEALKKEENNNKAAYNLGNSYYGKGDYPAASKMYADATRLAQTPGERADAYHNLGNAFLKQQKYKEAVNAYQNSLINRPGDPGTKQNLQIAKQKQQQQEQQQQQQNQNNQDQQQQNQNNQPNDQQQQNQQKSEQQQNQKPEQQQSGKQQEQQEPQIPKLEQPSQQFLEAIGREDRKNKRKYQEKTNNSKPGTKRKDW
jgi:Ca-activated chloride channel family protein